MTVRDPVLQGLSSWRALSGLSAAQIYLASRDDHTWFVRKVATDPSGSERLQHQARKQQRAGALDVPLRVPRVLDEGTVDGRYFFDMEFVRGQDGASHLRRASLDDVRRFASVLCAHIDSAANHPPIIDVPALVDPFSALFARVTDAHNKTNGALSDDVLGRLMLGLDRIRRMGPVKPTLCHGDMTLENLVVTESGQVYAIDLLDGPAEHWWFDVAKLHQDLDGGWYQRHEDTRALPLSVVRYVSGAVQATATRHTPQWHTLHNVFLATTFVRILPYTRTPEQHRFVLDRIHHYSANL
jgi:aminoglycoside phosphotransferase